MADLPRRIKSLSGLLLLSATTLSVTSCGDDDDCQPDYCYEATRISLLPADGWKVDGRYSVNYTTGDKGGCSFTFEKSRQSYCAGTVEIPSRTKPGTLLLGGLHDAVKVAIGLDSAIVFDEEVLTTDNSVSVGCDQECDERVATVEF